VGKAGQQERLSAGERYRVDAVSRAADILRSFTPAQPRVGAAELAERSGLSLAMARRTLLTLTRYDLMRPVEGEEDAYELGLAWLHLADIRRRQVDIRQIALPVMRQIRATLNETVILSIRSGNRRVNIDYVESTQATRRITQLGFEADLHIGATGRVLLAALSPEQLSAYLEAVPLVSYVSAKPIPVAKLKKELATVRASGYAVARHEITSDTAAVAAPIRDHRGEIVAVLTISCPEDRFTASLERACIEQATESAQEVSRFLGYSPS
jgi:DNA-binding IclR family transcriptional regulator